MRARGPSAMLLAAVLAAGAAGRLAAQSGSIAATVEVSNTALQAVPNRDLAFGTVVPGVARTIDPQTNVSAGEFLITGARNAQITVTMTLPAQLTTGTWTMPVTYGATSGCWRRQAGQAGCTYWDPTTVLTQRIRNQNPPNNVFYVWIGGTITPSPTQHGGMYYGTVILTAAYTGN